MKVIKYAYPFLEDVGNINSQLNIVTSVKVALNSDVRRSIETRITRLYKLFLYWLHC